jgi:hypothetical protein
MNVSVSTQLELLLLSRTLETIKRTPGYPISRFYSELNKQIALAPELSLSAHWNTIKSLVSVAPDTVIDKDNEDTSSRVVLCDVPELQHLKSPIHCESKHDPLLIVRNLFDTAVQAFPRSIPAIPDVASPLLTACLLLGAKSGRAGLLIHTALLIVLFREEQQIALPREILAELYELAQKVRTRESKFMKELQDHARKRKREHKKNPNPTIVLSCGKADHGEILFYLEIVV